MVRTAVILVLAVTVVAGSTLVRETTQQQPIKKEKEQEEKKASATKDLKVAATSYSYSKKGDGHGAFDHLLPSARLRLHSGLHYPGFRAFNFPTRYRIGGFGGGAIFIIYPLYFFFFNC